MPVDPRAAEKPGSAAGPSPVTIAMLFVLGVSFALAISLNRFAADGDVPFLPYVFWQSFGGGAALMLVAAALRRLPPIDVPHVRIFLSTGALNLAFPYMLLAYLAHKVPASLLTLGLSLVPVMIYALALTLRQERFHTLRFGGILLGLAGILLVLVPQASLPAPGMAGWVALGLVPSLSYAVNAVLIARWRPQQTTSLALGAGLMLASAGYVFIVMAATGEWWAFGGSFGIGHWATIAAMANNSVSFYLVFEVIRRAGPVIFSTVNYVATLSGMGFGMWFFGDAPSAYIWGASCPDVRRPLLCDHDRPQGGCDELAHRLLRDSIGGHRLPKMTRCCPQSRCRPRLTRPAVSSGRGRSASRTPTVSAHSWARPSGSRDRGPIWPGIRPESGCRSCADAASASSARGHPRGRSDSRE